MKNVVKLPPITGRRAYKTAEARVKLLYIKRYRDRHGHMRVYFRKPGHPKAILPGKMGSDEFMLAWAAALAQVTPMMPSGKQKPAKVSRVDRASVQAAIDSYQRSTDFSDLAMATKRARRRVLTLFGEAFGKLAQIKVTSTAVAEVLDSKPPGSARVWMSAIRAVFVHAGAADPTAGYKLRRLKRDDDSETGHHTWTEDEIAQFEAHHPIGGMPRVLFGLALNTGQRRGDLVRMGRHNIINGKLRVKQRKTGMTVTIPIHPELARIFATLPDIAPTFVIGVKGTSLSEARVNDLFRDWCRAAGLPDECVLHGLRKAICRRLVRLGQSPHQIMAITGHKTLAEIQRYCEEFSREIAGEQSMTALAGAYGARLSSLA